MAQKNLEATMVVVTAIKILVSSHQDIGKAALANLQVEGSWINIGFKI